MRNISCPVFPCQQGPKLGSAGQFRGRTLAGHSPYSELWAPWNGCCVAAGSAADDACCFRACGEITAETRRAWQEDMFDAVQLPPGKRKSPSFNNGFSGEEILEHWAPLMQDRTLVELSAFLAEQRLYALAFNWRFMDSISREHDECNLMYMAFLMFMESRTLLGMKDHISMDEYLGRSLILLHTTLDGQDPSLDWYSLISSGWPFCLMLLQLFELFSSHSGTLHSRALLNPSSDIVEKIYFLIRQADDHMGKSVGANVTRIRRRWLSKANVGFQHATRLMRETQGFEKSLEPLESYYHILSSLARGQKQFSAIEASSIERSRQSGDSADVQMLYCGQRELFQILASVADVKGWGLHAFIVKDSKMCDLREFHDWLSVVSMAVASAKHAVVFVSPWAIDISVDVLCRLVDMIRNGDAEIVGAHTIDGDGAWWWPARVIKRRYWKALFEVPPLGSVGSNGGICARADTTSGTRAYKPDVLAQMLNQLPKQRDISLLVALDFAASAMGKSVFTCMFRSESVLEEADYLRHVKMHRSIANLYGIEVIKFPGQAVSRLCSLHHYSIARFMPVLKGLVTPPCHADALKESFREVASWWLGMSDEHFIVPMKSTALLVLRGGDFPWQDDIDIVLHAPDYDIEEAMAQFYFILSRSHTANYTIGETRPQQFQIAYPLLSGQSVNLQVSFHANSSKESHPITAELFGMKIRLGSMEMDRLLSKQWPFLMKTGHPRFGEFRFLKCAEEGHNACLPSCDAQFCQLEQSLWTDVEAEKKIQEPCVRLLCT